MASVVGVLLAIVGCGGGPDGAAAGTGAASGTADTADIAADGGYIVATTGIWADIAGRVACDGSL
ncbi:MAG: hypothetical protein ABW195_07130, partial [Ilumatobacteraceae bacterium]